MTHRFRAFAPALVFAAACGACGKKGAPLPPLNLIPDAPAEAAAVRTAADVRLTFVLPKTNANGAGGPVALDRVEIFAVTIPPGGSTPPEKIFLSPANRVGTIAVKPPPVDTPPANAPPDTRPSPGEKVTFTETLTPAQFTPIDVPKDPATSDKWPSRVYVVRGATKKGRPGHAAPLLGVPLGDLPAAPANVKAVNTETAITVDWTAPVAAEGAPAIAFNIFKAGDERAAPLNPEPLTAPKFERTGVEFGVEQCFVVRAVQKIDNVALESEPSPRACLTPRDTFPPVAPKGLRGVASGAGEISLIWDANAEADLAGYLILRGEAGSDRLQPLVPSPIRETNYKDSTARTGVRYQYAIVAVDKAGNQSPRSTPFEETAR